MSELFTTRRQMLALGLGVPAVAILRSDVCAATASQVRIGAALIRERGRAAGAALVAANRWRLDKIDADASRLAGVVEEDFRARRTVAVDGVLLAEVEAACCVRAALGLVQ